MEARVIYPLLLLGLDLGSLGKSDGVIANLQWAERDLTSLVHISAPPETF